MSCSACSARVERAVGRLQGVQLVQVNLLTATMRVQYDACQTPESIIQAVVSAGYGASLGQASVAPRHENAALKQRFFISLCLLLPLVLLHHMWHATGSAIAQLLLSLPVLWINRHFFIAGVRAALKGSPNMDTLVVLGATAAMADGLLNFAMQHRDAFYFESAAMILTLITLGKWLESRATGRTGFALEKLMALLPQNATVLRDGSPQSIPAEAVLPGDILLIRAGERIPADATVLEGCSFADESALSGESMPVEKTAGCPVFAGSINGNGLLRARADKTRAESVLSGVIRLVGEAAADKAPIARFADRLSAVFVPIVVAVSVVTAVAWLWAGAAASFAVSAAIAVLVISCPCALGLATPVAIMVGIGKGAEAGILFRSAAALELLHKIRCVVVDKTGTVTSGIPRVADVLPAEGCSREALLRLAVTLESSVNHPLAAAILPAAAGIEPLDCQNHTYVPGRGVVAQVQGVHCLAGNEALMRQYAVDVPIELGQSLAQAGKTPLYFARAATYAGLIAVADTPKPDSAHAIAAMQQLGCRVVMLTGDNRLTAAAVARQCGITEFFADLLPQDKDARVLRMKAQGSSVAMVGDGINDAPALMRADVGIAIGAGTDIALESASVVLVRNSLSDVVRAILLSRAVVANIRQNLFWALFYNCLAIPLAAGVFYPWLGWQLHPAVAAAAMGLSSLCVVSNALRLRRCPLNSFSHMNTITIKVDGMMCPHCEAHVTKALLAIPGVEACSASHKDKCVRLTLSADVSHAVLRATIQAQGYTVL